jgi:hypothetical protein
MREPSGPLRTAGIGGRRVDHAAGQVALMLSAQKKLLHRRLYVAVRAFLWLGFGGSD